MLNVNDCGTIYLDLFAVLNDSYAKRRYTRTDLASCCPDNCHSGPNKCRTDHQCLHCTFSQLPFLTITSFPFLSQMNLKPLSSYCTTCVFISLSLLSTYCGCSLRDFASFYLFIFLKLCPNLWFHKWWCDLQAVVFTSFFSLFLFHYCTCVWICETGDKFSFVRSLQCGRRKVR